MALMTTDFMSNLGKCKDSYQIYRYIFFIYSANTQIERLTVELIEECAKFGEKDTVDLLLMSSIEIIFKSLSCMNGSLLKLKSEHICCSSENHGINIEKAETAFDLIKTMKNESLNNIVRIFWTFGNTCMVY